MNNIKLTFFKTAIQYLGVRYISGEKHNPIILSFFNKAGHIEIKDDETPWCSAFISAVLKDMNKVFSVDLTARSWLNVGKKVTIPEIGDLAIFWRESPTSWKGHVGIYLFHNDQYVWILGGNHDGQVSVIPMLKDRLIEFRSIFDDQFCNS
jgi:uncharacterized protein (TIGR02594 family)